MEVATLAQSAFITLQTAPVICAIAALILLVAAAALYALSCPSIEPAQRSDEIKALEALVANPPTEGLSRHDIVALGLEIVKEGLNLRPLYGPLAPFIGDMPAIVLESSRDGNCTYASFAIPLLLKDLCEGGAPECARQILY